MSQLIDFILNNYIWCLVIAFIVLFTLIGYVVDMNNIKARKEKKRRVTPIVNNTSEGEFEVHPSVEVYTNDDFDDPLIK